MKILCLTPRFPYPPIKGDKLRLYHFIRHLSKKHEIILVSIIESVQENQWIEQMKPYCRLIETHPITPLQSKIKCIPGLFSKLPLQVSYFYDTSLKSRLIQIIEHERPDLLYVNLIRAAYYLQDIPLPKIIDFVDAISLSYRREWESKSKWSSYWKLLESRKTAQFEQEVVQKYDHCIITNPIDKKAIQETDKITVLPNGVDTDKFPFLFKETNENKIIFTGNMSYSPNIDAVLYFAENCFPLIQKQLPNSIFIIAGISPTRDVQNLSRIKGIQVLGYVENIHACMADANVLVCPMRYGGGIKNKLLEAMASGIPIVTTTQGCEGISVKDHEHVLIANTPEEIAEKTVFLLNDRALAKQLSVTARKLIEKEYRWDILTEGLSKIMIQTAQGYH